MAIHLTTDGQLDFVTLQTRIHEQEVEVGCRLTSLLGKTESGVAFNAHVYESVDDNILPHAKLFIVSSGGGAAGDPVMQTWLASHPEQRVRCESRVYISGSLTTIAMIR
jgi:hypothetical protein